MIDKAIKDTIFETFKGKALLTVVMKKKLSIITENLHKGLYI